MEAHYGEYFGFNGIESTLISDVSTLLVSEPLVTWPTLCSKDLYEYLEIEQLGFSRKEYLKLVRKLIKPDYYGQEVKLKNELKTFVLINVEMVIIVFFFM